MFESFHYNVLLRGREEMVPFLAVLKNLVPLGEIVYLNLDADEAKVLKPLLFTKDKEKHWIAMRVNVPTIEDPKPGNDLTCPQRSIIANTKVPKMLVYTMDVVPLQHPDDPLRWDRVRNRPFAVVMNLFGFQIICFIKTCIHLFGLNVSQQKPEQSARVWNHPV